MPCRKISYAQRRLSVWYKKTVQFLLVPGALKSVLLGRDFIGPAQIGVHIGIAGWTVGKNKEIYTFIPSPECFILSSDFTITDDVVPSIESKNKIESIVNDFPSQEEDDVNENLPFETLDQLIFLPIGKTSRISKIRMWRSYSK
jgi:hypothetical protein